MIIKSKFKIPQKDEKFIYVPKLTELFRDTGAACIAVKAMSGFGKTTVFARLAGRCHHFVRWYTLDVTDNDRDCFLGCLESIWQTVDGRVKEMAVLQEGNAQTRLQALANRTQSWDCGRIYLIMDNLQVIVSEEVLQLLFLLQQYVEDKVTFVFLTNKEMPEGLLQLLIKGRGIFLAEDDLRFTPEEVLRYFGGSSGFSGEVLSQLTRDLLGWPLGVQVFLGYLQEKKANASYHFSIIGEAGASSSVTEVWNKILQESFLSRYLDKTVWEKEEAELRKTFSRSGAQEREKILEVCTFGAFQVTALKDGKELAWRTKKGRELFAYLLDIDGKAVGRRELMEVLWWDEIPEKAVALLHNMIYNIRKELSAYGLETILIYEKKRYRLGMEGIVCDFHCIRKIAELVEQGNIASLITEYKSFLDYWGSYLEDIDNCWAETKRGYYDEIYKKGCFMLAEQFTRDNNTEIAIKLYQNILLVEPYSEKAVEKMLLLYGKQREWEKVRRCYAEFKETLERDLGIVPGNEVMAAYHQYLPRCHHSL